MRESSAILPTAARRDNSGRNRRGTKGQKSMFTGETGDRVFAQRRHGKTGPEPLGRRFAQEPRLTERAREFLHAEDEVDPDTRQAFLAEGGHSAHDHLVAVQDDPEAGFALFPTRWS